MEFLPLYIQQYAEAHTSSSCELLKRIDRETNANIMKPRMLSGHLQGRVLSMLSHMIKPQLILEIGTYTGYSAICLAEGLIETGKLITIEVNEELESLIEGYFQESEFTDQLDLKIGKAIDLIPSIDGSFDLVFIDADKTGYKDYYELVINKMSKGGFIIADNVLWSGKVTESLKARDKDTRALIEFNEFVHNDSRVENILFPVRDGLMTLRAV